MSPTDPRNAVIVDIDRAPRNAQGLVEATAEVEILRPTNAASGNRRLFYDVVNRGSKPSFSNFNDVRSGNTLAKAADAGTGFLMNRGYTVVWSGWQGDVNPGGGRMSISLPVVPDVTGLSREEFVFDKTDNPITARLTYPAASLDPTQAKLTVRARQTDPHTTPADLTFKFEASNRISISRPAGFDAGAIYEFIYTAKDPKVMGLGYAATRDLITFLRRETADASGTPNVLAGRIDHAIGFGRSQSGRFLHDFLYLGFNEDESGRMVFDGLMPHVSGGKKMFTNYRFAQPGRNMVEHGDTAYPGAQFPFSYPVVTDALTGRSDGWLKRCLASSTCPKIIQTDTDTEFYQNLASLVVTDTEGNALAMPDNVRVFLLASLEHAAQPNARSAPVGVCTYQNNPLYAGPSLRALLIALDEWISKGTPAPASRYPSRADGTLVPPTAAAVGFPPIPGLDFTGLAHRANALDHAAMPPARGKDYPVFVPRTDADGNAIAGIRLPTLSAPVGTHLGWNVRKAGFSQGALCGNNGAMLPFARTREERIKANDPRPSLAERYPNAGDRAAIIEKAARQLVQDRLLLEEDVASFLQATN